ncbi:MAG: DUF423 domain-containing protein [Gemmatimonadota bacterium]
MATGTSLQSRFGLLGAILGFLGVALGAFGTHALAGSLPAARLATFETAVRYQLIHAVALVALSAVARRAPTRALALAGLMMALGALIFCGSLYLLVLLDQPALGAVTPLGGVCFLVGWMSLAAHYLALRRMPVRG